MNLPHAAASPVQPHGGGASLSALIAASQEPEIVLAAGTYHGQLVLARPVTLTASEGAGSVRIVAEQGPAVVVRGDVLLRGIAVESLDQAAPALSVAAGAPVFEYCEFRGARVEALGGSTPTFRQCSFADTALAGLYAKESSRPLVEGCTFAEVRGHAVVVADAAVLELRDSLLERVGGTGLRLLGTARADVYTTTIRATSDPGAAVADAAALRMTSCRIVASGAEGLRIDDSCVPPETDRYAFGQDPDTAGTRAGAAQDAAGAAGRILAALSGGPVAELRGVALVDCEIADCAQEGAVVGGGHLRMERTRITGAGRSGLLAGGRAGLELRGCAVTGSVESGVLLRGQARLRAEGVVVARCGADGVAAAENALLELRDSTVEQTDACAIRLSGHAAVRARGSRIRASRTHGLCLLGSSSAELEGCRVEACAHEGVRVEDAADAVLRDCEFSQCRTGIMLSTRRRPDVRGCTVRETRQHGIVVGRGGSPVLEGCRVQGAASVGIYLDDGGAARLADCLIEGAGHAGLLVGAEAAPAVRGLAVSGTGEAALYFKDGAAGVFEDCYVATRAGVGEAVRLGHGARPDLRTLRTADAAPAALPEPRPEPASAQGQAAAVTGTNLLEG